MCIIYEATTLSLLYIMSYRWEVVYGWRPVRVSEFSLLYYDDLYVVNVNILS